MALTRVVTLVFAVSLVGCAHGAHRPAAPVLAPFSPLHEGGESAVGLLDFVNDHGHDLELLDRALGLDARAAAGIVAHRQGPDGQLGSADDGWFTSLAELDAVTWVGPTALDKLAGYAAAQGYMNSRQRVVGSFDGVSFTFDQAERTLALANSASVGQLDRLYQLDRRAVDSIVSARPLRSMEQLSELYWVGPATLARLRAHAETRTLASR
jgi:DNA uptake protein ComE-like DNA-binding protein